MNLVCPHNKKIQVVKTFGIITYEHENGSQCDLLNNYSVSIYRIVNTMVKNCKIDLLLSDKKARVLCDNKEIVNYFVKTLKQCNMEEIICLTVYLIMIDRRKLINKLISIIGNDFVSIVQAICDEFGISRVNFNLPLINKRKINLKFNGDYIDKKKIERFKFLTIHEIKKIVSQIDRRYNNA